MKKAKKEEIIQEKIFEKPSLISRIINKVEIFLLIFFALSLFLMDNNLNITTAYGPGAEVTIFGDLKSKSTDMFWTGFIASFIIFLFICFRSVYRRQSRLSKLDMFFGIFGAIGFMILLSGGLLGFWHPSSFEIPFFSFTLTRVSYYHMGIAINIVTLFYFAMTK